MIKIPEQVLSELSGKFGTSAESLRFLGGGREDSDGTVFTFDLDGKTNILKILAIPKKESEGLIRLEERVKFVHFLGENGIRISYPEVNIDGRLYETIENENHIFTGYRMKLCEGCHPKQEELTHEFYKAWGRVTGKMHRITKLYPHWMNIPSGKEEALSGWQEELDMFYEWCKDEDVKKKWQEMKERLSVLPLNRDTYGFIHNDNHTQNVLWNSKDITLIDFDVANCNFFITDIVVPLQGLLFDVTGGMISPVNDRDTLKSALDDFMNGYEQENHLGDFWLQQIDTFVSYRRLLLFTVMQEWLNTEAELKQRFKSSIECEPHII